MGECYTVRSTVAGRIASDEVQTLRAAISRMAAIRRALEVSGVRFEGATLDDDHPERLYARNETGRLIGSIWIDAPDLPTRRSFRTRDVYGPIGAVLPARFAGLYRRFDAVWFAYVPIGRAMSDWVRLEAPGKRTRFIYDADGAVRTALRVTNPHCWRGYAISTR